MPFSSRLISALMIILSIQLNRVAPIRNDRCLVSRIALIRLETDKKPAFGKEKLAQERKKHIIYMNIDNYLNHDIIIDNYYQWIVTETFIAERASLVVYLWKWAAGIFCIVVVVNAVEITMLREWKSDCNWRRPTTCHYYIEWPSVCSVAAPCAVCISSFSERKLVTGIAVLDIIKIEKWWRWRLFSD